MADSARTEPAYRLPAPPPGNHGHTVAAWSAMVAVMVGAVVVALGMILSATWLIVVGAVIVLAGLLGGFILRHLGFGQKLAGE